MSSLPVSLAFFTPISSTSHSPRSISPPSAPPNTATCRSIPRNEAMWHETHLTNGGWLSGSSFNLSLTSFHFSSRWTSHAVYGTLSRRIIGHCSGTNGCSIATKHTEARLPVLKTDVRESLLELICDNTKTFRTVTCASKLVVVTLPSCESNISRNRTPIKYRLPKPQTISGLSKNSASSLLQGSITFNLVTGSEKHRLRRRRTQYERSHAGRYCGVLRIRRSRLFFLLCC